jgi:MYXO-CTERM domain-containing protein
MGRVRWLAGSLVSQERRCSSPSEGGTLSVTAAEGPMPASVRSVAKLALACAFAACGERMTHAPSPVQSGVETKSAPLAGQVMTWRRANLLQGRGGHAMAGVGSQVVLFGGVDRLAERDVLSETWVWDGEAWSRRHLRATPAARERAAMATLGDRVVMFGGAGATHAPLDDTWIWDGSWTRVTPVIHPGARSDHAMATLGNKVVLFGGTGPTEELADTWEWDGEAWKLQAPAASPPPRRGHGMAPLNGKVVLFGGKSAATSLADIWEWDGSTWTERPCAGGPTPRFNFAMAPLGSSIVLFGGMATDRWGESFSGDTWKWDGAQWSRVNSSIAPRFRTTSMVATDGGLLLFGGESQAGSPFFLHPWVFHEDTWVFDGLKWTLKNSGANPIDCQGLMAVGPNLLALGPTLDDQPESGPLGLWAWDGAAWTKVANGEGPPWRLGFASATLADGLLLFGGQGWEPGYMEDWSDTWLWDGTAWTLLTPIAHPRARIDASAGSLGSEVFLYGGEYSDNYLQVLSDTWKWAGDNWGQLIPQRVPPGREGASLATHESALVLLGGLTFSCGENVFPNDMWEWDGTNWAPIRTVPQPPGRVHPLLASHEGKLVLHGGMRWYWDSSRTTFLYSDTWEWDGGGWAQLQTYGGAGPTFTQGGMASFGDRIVLVRGSRMLGQHCTTWELLPLPANGSPCSVSSECASGYCSRGICCNTSCSDPTESCGAQGDEGTCRVLSVLGTKCSSATQCASGFCGDGLCCDGRCAGQCETCISPGREGLCTPVLGAPRSGRAACASDGSPCGGICDGLHGGSCTFPGGTVLCRAPTCSFGMAVVASMCDGEGACPVPETRSCDTFACAGNACATRCLDDSQCAGGNGCREGICTPLMPVASRCDEDRKCLSGYCVDGVCCEARCGGQCEACDLAESSGTCDTVEGAPRGDRQACTDGFECRSGVCSPVVSLAGGCGCSSGGEAVSVALLAVLAAALRIRRRDSSIPRA